MDRQDFTWLVAKTNFISKMKLNLITIILLSFILNCKGQKDNDLTQKNKFRTAISLTSPLIHAFYQLNSKSFLFIEAGAGIGISKATDEPLTFDLLPKISTDFRYFLKNKPIIKDNDIDYSGIGKGLYFSLGHRLIPYTLIPKKSHNMVNGWITEVYTNEFYLHTGVQTIWKKRLIASSELGVGYQYKINKETPSGVNRLILPFNFRLRLSYLLY